MMMMMMLSLTVQCKISCTHWEKPFLNRLMVGILRVN